MKKFAAVNRSRTGKSFSLMQSTAHVTKRDGSRSCSLVPNAVIRSGFKSFDEARAWGVAQGWTVF